MSPEESQKRLNKLKEDNDRFLTQIEVENYVKKQQKKKSADNFALSFFLLTITILIIKYLITLI